MSSSKNIFMTVKSFLNFSIIFYLSGLLTNSSYYSSVKALLLTFPSFNLIYDLYVIMHCHFDKTRMNISAFVNGISSFYKAKQLWIFKDKWFKKTALFLLKRNQFFILLMIAFFTYDCSCF